MTRSQAKIDIGARGDAELVVQPLAPVDAEHEHELTRRVEQRGLGARAHGDRQRALSVGPDEAREQRRLELVDLGRGRGAAAVRLQPARDDAERRVQQRRVGRAARPRRRAALGQPLPLLLGRQHGRRRRRRYGKRRQRGAREDAALRGARAAARG